MKVTAFVGASGTGKSHHALVVAHDHHIDCIIDDGILIYHNRIVAGQSAKQETNQLKAVRRAIFQDAKQADDVKKALERIKPERLLILGTSERMAKKITQVLGLPVPSDVVYIEDVSSLEEIQKAHRMRIKEGKHVIPVPTMELRPHYKGYFFYPIRSFFSRAGGKKRIPTDERSVVRPIFSYYGKLTFTDEALTALVQHGLKMVSGITDVDRIRIRTNNSDVANGLKITLSVKILYGENIKKVMNSARKQIQHEIEYTTGMSVDRLEVSISGVSTRR